MEMQSDTTVTTFTMLAVALSSVAFSGHGLSCFLSRRVATEFERYGVARLRPLVGSAQIAASVGLVAGVVDGRLRPLLILSAAGLAAMMVGAVLVRLRIRDPWTSALPALGFFCLNLYIATSA
jgi:hypothetical protein